MPYAVTTSTPAPVAPAPFGASRRAASSVVRAFAFALGRKVNAHGEAAAAVARLIDRKAGVAQAAAALRAGIAYAERTSRLAAAVGIEAQPPELAQMRAALAELERAD